MNFFFTKGCVSGRRYLVASPPGYLNWYSFWRRHYGDWAYEA